LGQNWKKCTCWQQEKFNLSPGRGKYARVHAVAVWAAIQLESVFYRKLVGRYKLSTFRHTTDVPELPRRFANVRMAVGFLGQGGSSVWWSSTFLSPNGLAIAEYNFPRAAGHSALNATAAAAKRLHDDRIGKRRCVHLFRLALADEVLIQRTFQPNGRATLDPVLLDRGDALKLLEAESREVISVDAGPIQIGTIEDAFTEAGLGELVKHYLAAFRQGIQCLPYFANARK
jgi:hypothetical protein